MKQDIPLELMAAVHDALKRVWRGEISEVKVVSTKAGADVLLTDKKKYVEPKRR